jgi:hypothetical protein
MKKIVFTPSWACSAIVSAFALAPAAHAQTPDAAKIKVAFSRYDVRGQEVTLKGKWLFGSCGSGDQVMRFVYSPQLDFVVERDRKSFTPNGIFNSGNLTKVTAVN